MDSSSDKEAPVMEDVPKTLTLTLTLKKPTAQSKQTLTLTATNNPNPRPEEEEEEEEGEPNHHGISDPEEVPKDQSDDNNGDDDPNNEPSDDTSSESGSEESEEFAENQEDYFNATSYKNYRHHWLCGFFKYLSLPDAGNKKKVNRLQHARQVEIVLEAIDKNGDDITPLAGQGATLSGLTG